MKMTRTRSALLGTGAVVALLAAQVPASADEIEELRTQIQSLQNKMGKLEAAQRRKRRVAPAAAVEAGAKPRSWKLPGTNTSMQIGGYAKLDLIYDINVNTGDQLAAIGTVPADGTAAANRQQHFRLHARQSRLYVRTWTPTDWGEMSTHIEGDFFNTNDTFGTETVSNSYGFRLRQAYGTLGPVLAGQTWSTFMILESLPDTLDFSGPSGVPCIRAAVIRYTHSFGGGTVAVFAVENPHTSGADAIGLGATAPLVAGGTGVPDPIPDFVVGLTHTWGSGRASLRALFRQINVDDGAGVSDSVFGWAIHGGFGWRFNNRRTAIGMGAYYGRGLGRYVIASSLNGTAAVANGPTGALNLRSVAQYGGQIWIQHRWTDTLRSSLVYGRSRNDYVQQVTGGKNASGARTQDYWTVHTNLIWSPVARVDIGVEYIYAFNGIVNSANGEVHRIMMSFKYNF